MTKLSISNLALAGALALGLGTAMTVAPTLAGLDGVAMARGGGGGGGGGASGADGGIDGPERLVLPPRVSRGQVITYVNEFPEDDPPIIIIPFPRRVSAQNSVGQMEPCYQNGLRPNARIVCERRARN